MSGRSGPGGTTRAASASTPRARSCTAVTSGRTTSPPSGWIAKVAASPSPASTRPSGTPRTSSSSTWRRGDEDGRRHARVRGARMIGTLRETSLHAALKQWYARPADDVEAEVDGYVVDLRRGDTLIEIQTCNFAAIRRKLLALVERHPVRLLHPIASE